MKENYWARGQWNAICDDCGEQYVSSKLMKRWDGFMVCRKCWEPRNAQDFVKGIPEKPIPWSRPGSDPFPEQTVQRFVDGSFVGETWVG